MVHVREDGVPTIVKLKTWINVELNNKTNIEDRV